MNVQIVSDLHLERGGSTVIQPQAPHLALLGDIGAPFEPHYAKFLQQQAQQFSKVFVVLGNHEFYGSEHQEVVNKVQSICDTWTNVHLLHRTTYRLTASTVLVGCTLWSDLQASAAPLLNDLRRILVGPERHRLDLATYRQWHSQDVAFIQQALQQWADLNVVVLTHHAPSHSMQGIYAGSASASAFATPLEHLMNKPVVAWASGHVHSNVDTTIQGVRSVSNCKGYAGEHTGYRSDVIIDVPL